MSTASLKTTNHVAGIADVFTGIAEDIAEDTLATDDAAPVPASTWKGFLQVVLAGQHEMIVQDADGHRFAVLPEARYHHLKQAAGLPGQPGGHAGQVPAAGPTAHAVGHAVGHAAAVRLTTREQQILQLAAQGRPASVTATGLGLATNTVAQHLAAVRRKYGVHSTAAAIALARRSGLIH